MLRLTQRWTLGGLTALCALAPLHAHEDDPKVLDQQPPSLAPGYRLGQQVPGQGQGGGYLGFSSSGVTLLANMTPSQLDGNGANDCWSYVAPSGREYALVCTSGSTIFVEVTNPVAPQTIATFGASSCTWRDVKVFGHHAYSVSECGAGIQVFDMSNIDNGQVQLVNTITTGGTTDSHNVAIDTTSGYLYRCGGGSDLGFRIYDLNANPANPQYITTWQDRYIHDAQIVTYTSGPFSGTQVAFCSSGNGNGSTNTRFEILNVTNKNNIQVMGTVFYPGAQYSHQGWASEDLQFFYLGDELDEGNLNIDSTTHVFDISNLNAPSHAGSFENGNPAITHNLYTRDGLIFEANYRSGLRVFDTNVSPTNPPEVGFFDTYNGSDSASFNGLWSCCPYFDSGIVIGSDTQLGLFIWDVSSLTSEVTFDFPNGIPPTIDPGGDTILVEITELVAGAVVSGSEMLVYDAGAGPVSVPLNSLGGDLYDAVFPATPCGTTVSFYIQTASSGGGTDESSVESTLSAGGVSTIALYTMESNSGWVSGAPGDDATTGQWERVDPIGTAAAPEDDHTVAGTDCWITDQHSGGGVGTNDIDNGVTTLLSPILDMAGAIDPQVSYWRWYVNNGNNTVDDQFEVDITNGGAWINVETLGGSQSGGWKNHVFTVSDFVNPTATVQMRFRASDEGGGSIVEAGIDDFEVVDILCGPVCGVSNYCSSSINSTGNAGVMTALGSTSIAANDLVLEAFGLPSGQPGIFYFGPNQISLAFGNGTRCVGGTVFRFPPVNSNVFGVANQAVDYNSLPFGASIQAGDTWNFQHWFRDPAAGGANFDLSDGLEALFCP